MKVLKDINFILLEKNHLDITEPERNHLIKMMRQDTDKLREWNLMDYSLMVIKS
jgi:hypothetical protein